MTKKMLTKYFSEEEVRCKCGCGMMPQQVTIDDATEVREELGFPLVPNSWARCPTHNRNVGGAPSSYHMKGLAIDWKAGTEEKKWAIAFAFMKRGYSVRVAKTFVHVDARPGKPKLGLY